MTGTDSLLELLRAFDEHGVPYMVVGSYSSNFYGMPRMTKDADVVVHLPSSEWSKIPTVLPAGIAITATRREILQVEGTRFTIELFRLSDDPHDRMRFERRKQLEIFPGSFVFLPTPEDVIVQKLRWNKTAKRGKDFDDVVAVMATLGPEGLDWDYIRQWCGLHETLDLMEEARSTALKALGKRD